MLVFQALFGLPFMSCWCFRHCLVCPSCHVGVSGIVNSGLIHMTVFEALLAVFRVGVSGVIPPGLPVTLVLQALFNLAFMLEEGALIPTSVWKSLRVKRKHYSDNVTLLMELYER